MFFRKCDNCGGIDERVFTDSWSGHEFCVSCLAEEPETGVKNPLWFLTMSPSEDGDNIEELFPGVKESADASA
jgi:hypothetical protein